MWLLFVAGLPYNKVANFQGWESQERKPAEAIKYYFSHPALKVMHVIFTTVCFLRKSQKSNHFQGNEKKSLSLDAEVSMLDSSMWKQKYHCSLFLANMSFSNAISNQAS
jgi:hypothetical protein